MTTPRDPHGAPEDHGLANVRGGRLLALAVAVVVVVAAVALVRTCSRPASREAQTPTATESTVALDAAAAKQAGLSVEPVRRLTRTDRVEAPGVLALDEKRTARLGSLVEGVVVRTLAEVGDRVQAAQVLAEIDSHVVQDAWAAYRRAVSDRRRRETELAYAKQAEERAGRLLAEKAISRQELQRAEADRIDAEAQLEMAATEIRRAEEALEHLGVTNAEDPTGETGEYIPIKSPLRGVVLGKTVTQGTAVTPGAPLFVVADLSELWASAEIDEKDVPRVAAGRPVELRVAAYPGEAFAGRITFVADMVNARTRRVTVRCQVPNPDGRLKPEMYASLALGAGEAREVLAVPSAAVQELRGKPIVFVRTTQGSFERRDVTLGAESEGWIEVRSGVAEAELVVTTGAFLLKSELLRGALAEGE